MKTAVADAVEQETGLRLEPLNVEQYLSMIETGVLPEGERIELLDGVLVRTDRRDAGGDVTTEGRLHLRVRQDLYDLLLPLVRPHGFHCNTNGPVLIPPRNAPEPDVVVLPGRRREYEVLPTAADVVAAIEVSWSSLRTDRETKQGRYAAAGVPTYWILNLAARRLIAHTAPDPSAGEYRTVAEHPRTAPVSLPLGAGVAVDVPLDDLLRD